MSFQTNPRLQGKKQDLRVRRLRLAISRPSSISSSPVNTVLTSVSISVHSQVPAASSPCSFNFATGYGLFSLRRSNYGSLVQIFSVQLVGAPHITDPAAILNGKRVKISIIQRSQQLEFLDDPAVPPHNRDLANGRPGPRPAKLPGPRFNFSRPRVCYPINRPALSPVPAGPKTAGG